jgi:hypothetical protein
MPRSDGTRSSTCSLASSSVVPLSLKRETYCQLLYGSKFASVPSVGASPSLMPGVLGLSAGVSSLGA